MSLTLGSQPLLVDRGTLTYVGPERNEFRATSSHNTLEFGGESSIQPLGPFQWGPRPRPPWAQLQEFGPLALFQGVAEGHCHTEQVSRHERYIAHLRDGAWLVADKGIRDGSFATARWQFAAGLDVRPTRRAGFDVWSKGGQLLANALFLGHSAIRVRNRTVSPRYGRLRDAMLVESDVAQGAWLVTLLIPRAPADGIDLLEQDAIQPGAVAWRQGEDVHCVVMGDAAQGLALPGGGAAGCPQPQVLWRWGPERSNVRTCVAICDITDPVGHSRASVLRLRQTGSDTMPHLEILEILDPDRCAASAG